ncbi:MAG: penicillin-binding protein 2 [Patescibacteria group bacterium]|nr:penicillin-binding protein 2 [Patescibacteria group bacterium]
MRLFVLQVLSYDFYSALASDQHGIFAELFPERGAIYLSDPKSLSGVFPAAVNRDMALVYAVPRDIEDPHETAEKVAEILELDAEEIERKLSLEDDPYEPLKRRVSDEVVESLRALELSGIHFAPEAHRFYPEKSNLSHVLGFVGSDEDGERVGRYGVEGYWNAELGGQAGYLETERDPVGRWIGTAERSFRPAEDGVDIVLTIDRTIQYVACDKLNEAVERHGASGGAVVILEPDTGAVLAMCGEPNFDPNTFSTVEDISVFNNPAIFDAYEPGSIFKPVTMSAAIDSGKVGPNTLYNDEGQVKIGPYTIRNSDGKSHGWQTMTQVLEKSLNTGTIFAVTELGPKDFLEYVEGFGFGSTFGIEIDTESRGNISSLEKRGDIWSATASYGQGITVTPLQMAAAFGAIANGGKLMQPHVVDRLIYPDGKEEKTGPTVVRQVITKRAAALVGGMLVKVVEDGHGTRAGVPGYWIAGKTGTAQIPKEAGSGYEEEAFIGSFVGFAPVDDPEFVMLVKIERPTDVQWAESSAAPLFGEIAEFLLNYRQIPPSRAK